MKELDLIDRTEMIESLSAEAKRDGTLQSMLASYAIEKLRHAKRIEVDKSKSKWERNFNLFRCAKCGADNLETSKYCPSCGKYMKNAGMWCK